MFDGPKRCPALAEKITGLFSWKHTYEVERRQRGLGTKKTVCPDSWVVVHHLQSQSGILDPDDRLSDVADDREQILASFEDASGPPSQGDGASGSSVGTGSPDIFRVSDKYHPPHIEVTGEHQPGGLQVRRGSEPSLLQAEPRKPGPPIKDRTKRWSAAPICRDDDGPDRLLGGPGGYLGPQWDTHPESDIEVNPEREPSPNHFQRSGRLSMQFLGEGTGYRWAEAAERASASHALGTKSLPRDCKRREPLGQSNSSTSSPRSREFEGTELTLVLKEPGAPLGLRASPDSQHGGLIVQSVEPDGRAARGNLKQGDRILDINGTDLLNLPLYKVQDVFKRNINAAELRLRIFRRTGGLDDVKDCTAMVEVEERPIGAKIATVSPTKKVPGKQPPTLLSSNTRRLGRKIDITLKKGPHGLGFSVTTRDNPAGGHCPIYIKNILPRGAAVEDGRLRPGDRLLEVNGETMTGRSQAEVVGVLRATPPGAVVNIVVSRQDAIETNEREIGFGIEEQDDDIVPVETIKEIPEEKTEPQSLSSLPVAHFQENHDSSSSNDSFVFPWRHREVMTLDIPVHDSEKAGLGVSVKGKTGSPGSSNVTGGDLGIFVKSVLHGGAASRDGKLKTNDQLLNVNGVSLLQQSNAEAMETLRRAMLHTEGRIPGSITLTVARKVSHGSSPSVGDTSRKSQRSAGSIDADLGELSDSNCLEATVGNTVIYVPNRKSMDPVESWNNPVIERLTGNTKNTRNAPNNYGSALRNESYYMATNDTWLSVGSRHVSPTVNLPSADPILIEEDSPGSTTSTLPLDHNGRHGDKTKRPILEHINTDATLPISPNTTNEPATPSDATYASQLSLDVSEVFSRDAIGRRSMSEKHHAALDAKGTGTYQRNKKLREQREREQKERNDMAKAVLATAGSIESLTSVNKSADSRPEDADRLCELGPSLGLKKSSSLESLQTMVQEIQMGDDRVHNGLRPIRGRACGDSLRAVVEAPTDTQARKHWLTEDGSEHAFTHRNGPLQSSLTDGKLKSSRTKKHKPGLLKGIGSMFRFGKHRKDSVADITSSTMDKLENRNEKYDKPDKYHHKLDNYDRKIEKYDKFDYKLDSIDSRLGSKFDHDDSKSDSDRPLMPPKYQNPPPVGSTGVPDSNSNQFSHYVNYEEIQNHLSTRCDRLSESQIAQMRRQVLHQRGKVEEESRRQHLYHSTRSNRSDPPQRPVSSYYEYESAGWSPNNPNPSSNKQPYPGNDLYTQSNKQNYGSQPTHYTPPPPALNMNHQSGKVLPKYQPVSGPALGPPLLPREHQKMGLPKPRGPYVTQVTIKEQHSGSKV